MPQQPISIARRLIMNNGYPPLVIFLLGLCGTLFAQAPTDQAKAWNNPKIRAWQDYPFVAAPPQDQHHELWRNFDELPQGIQRGRLIYGHARQFDLEGLFYGHKGTQPDDDATLDESRRRQMQQLARSIKNSGVTVLHLHGPNAFSAEIAKILADEGLILTARVDGKHYFGNYDIWRIHDTRGGISTVSGLMPNHDWWRKFPPVMAANVIMRDGNLAFEYYGSATQRRTLNYIHPISLQVRDALLRELLLGEQVFDLPIRREVRIGGHLGGVWFDNPGNNIPSFDSYSRDYTRDRKSVV